MAFTMGRLSSVVRALGVNVDAAAVGAAADSGGVPVAVVVAVSVVTSGVKGVVDSPLSFAFATLRQRSAEESSKSQCSQLLHLLAMFE